jgi:acetyltransferase-like isoleucine patch superfamily enzyme
VTTETRAVRAFHALQEFPRNRDNESAATIGLRQRCKSFGYGVRVGELVQVLHPETFEIGDGVFIGGSAFLQGRHDGRFVVGRGTWIGPQAYIDCRDAELGEYVGFGPGAKILGSEHTGDPTGIPIIQTDLIIQPVRIEKWADIGTGAIILPGVTVGEGAIVGAGAVVTENVRPYTIVAGVPARYIRSR